MPELMVELAHRRKSHAPPRQIVWEALVDPMKVSRGRVWFDLQPDEVAPTILSADTPREVHWSSIWTDEPDLRIEFGIEASNSGSVVTWRLFGLEGQLDPQDVKDRRYRLNQLVNGNLRDYFDL